MMKALPRAARATLWGSSLLIVGSVLAGAGGVAFAQQPAAPPTPPPPSPSITERSEVETVFVSARKVEERAIDTPVSLATLSEVQLQRYNTTDLTQLSSQLPGIIINRAAGGGAGGNFTIRGIGNIATDYGAEQPVALVIDGFSFTRGHIIDVGFFDLENVEVFKGPQTLFFGKNSPAGVVAVKSKSPGNTFEGFVKASYEFTSVNPEVEVGVSIPFNDKFAMRVAARGQFMQEGYYENTAAPIARNIGPFETQALYPSRGKSYDEYPEQRQAVGRVTFVIKPTDNFDVTIKLFGSRSKQNDAGITGLYKCADGVGGSPYLNSVFFGLFKDTTQVCTDRIEWKRNGALPPTAVADANPFITPDDRFKYQTRNFLGTMEMNLDLGEVKLSSVSGYWDYKHREYTNYDYTSYSVVTSLQGESGHSWTTEFRARWEPENLPVKFMVGGFYEDTFRDLDAPVQIFPLGPAPAGSYPQLYWGTFLTYHQHWDNNIRSYSFFGEFRWNILDNLELSGGLRYTADDRDSFGGNIFNRLDTFLPPAFNPFSPSGVFYTLNRSFENTSPQGTLTWKPTENSTLYFSYKTGFQAAGISNPGTVPNLVGCAVGCPKTQAQINESLTFDGSTVKGFEFGAKGELFDGRMVADIAFYRMNYSDLQVAIFNPITTTFTIQNAAAARNQGVEGSVTYQLTDSFQVRVAAQYNDLKFTSYTDAECYPGQLVTAAPLCHVGASGANIQDMSGENYGGPPFQLNGGFTWNVNLSPAWGLELASDVTYMNKGRTTLRQPDTDVPSRKILNSSVRLFQNDGPWEVALICTNCANNRYLYGIGNKPLAKTGDLTGFLGVPRLVTVQATYRW